MESDGASDGKHGDGHASGVTEVKDGSNEGGDLERRNEVKEGVEEDIGGRSSGREEGTPPPAMILAAELEVDHDDRNFRAGDDKYEQDDEKEGEEVVDLLQPDRGEDKEKFNEDGTEGQDTAEEDRKERIQVPHLRRDGTRDVVDAHRVLDGRATRREMSAHHGQWYGDAEPESNQSEQVQEGNSSRGSFRPQEEVEEEEDAKDETRQQGGGSEGVLLPILAIEHEVDASGRISSDHAHADERHQTRSYEQTAAGRRQETKCSEYHRDDSHCQ